MISSKRRLTTMTNVKMYKSITLMLLITSLTAVCMLLYRMYSTESIFFGFFIWNLFLAWVPFSISCLLYAFPFYKLELWKKWIWWILSTFWLLFYPNAPYLLTDFIHLKHVEFIIMDGYSQIFNPDIKVWYDLIMFSLFIGIGILLGCLSLYQMQSIFSQAWGRLYGWLIALLILILTSYGIYLGRFNRLNSWDITQPVQLINELVLTVTVHTAGFVFIFFCFLLFVYTIFCQLISMSSRER